MNEIITVDEIREFIDMYDIPVKNLKSVLGISTQTYYYWVNGVHTPSRKLMYRMKKNMEKWRENGGKTNISENG